MRRNKLLIINHNFGSKWWLKELFPNGNIDNLKQLNQITRNHIVVFEGGVDINPLLYSKKRNPFSQQPDTHRDLAETHAFNKAREVGAGCLGICRGAQLLTALSGGSLIQHVSGHHGLHPIVTSQGGQILATSSHHQMMYPFNLPDGEFDLLAWSKDPLSTMYLGEDQEEQMVPDKEPEVVWYPKTDSLAIQGHPEWAKEDGVYVQYCRGLVRRYLQTV